MRRIVSIAGALALAGVLVASVGARTIVGTKKNDVLRGTAKADTINGKAGNDTLFGLGGNDSLTGGPGNDKLVGGPGKDRYNCGPGKDVVIGDAADIKPGADCEVANGFAKPALSVGDASGVEGNAGTTTLSFPVTLSAAGSQPVSVSFTTADGTATAPSDYTAVSSTLTFKPGEKSKTIDVAVVGETVYEQDETLTVTLSSPVNATIADGSATGTIQNDDARHYAGTTIQGQAISFDVSADRTALTNLNFLVNTSACNELPLIVTDIPVSFAGPIAINAGGTFNSAYTWGDLANGMVNGSIQGSFDPSGKASGTLTGEFDINIGFVLHCPISTVSWNAA
jgi:hypothetical protein